MLTCLTCLPTQRFLQKRANGDPSQRLPGTSIIPSSIPEFRFTNPDVNFLSVLFYFILLISTYLFYKGFFHVYILDE
jgi:hypothetical protein